MLRSCAAKRGGSFVLSKLRSSASLPSCRSLSAGASPLGDGGLEFQTKRYPSFWNRLKQQKHGLGNMALSASIAFLAISIIKQEKELTRANKSADLMRRQNEALKERLEGVKMVLVKSEEGEKTERDIVALLREVLDLNGEGHAAQVVIESPDTTDSSLQKPSRSKFMV